MTFDPSNPIWTAYLAGELTDDERADVEAQLAESPEARELVADLRRTILALTSELAAEPTPSVPVMAVAERGREESARRIGWLGPALAISLVLLTSLSLLVPSVQQARSRARNLSSRVQVQTPRDSASSNELDLAVPNLQAKSGRRETAYAVAKPTYPAKPRGDIAYDVAKPVYETAADANLLNQNGGADHLGRETQSLTTMVTPRIVIQEEEEERLGILNDESLLALRKGNNAGKSGLESYNTDMTASRLSVSKAELMRGTTESYEPVTDNPFRAVLQEPLSTFSIDVDTASFANVRRFIVQNRRLPPPAAVRIEELVNYFHYDYPRPEGDVPFSVHTEVAGCPWNAGHRLVKIGLAGREIARENRPPSNLVFLVDVSGSMNEPNKLPLVKDALKLLVGQLTENDRVAMVVYAGTSGLVLPSTGGSKPAEIRAAIDRLEAGGSTNGGAGIQLAYETALQNFIGKGNNRVILATDGDFNVGITNRDELVKFVAAQAASGVYLTTLGFGFGNLKDNMLEQLADKGNGNYAYIDDLREAHKVLVEEMSGTLVTIAKDVKIQLEFNPAAVAAFRLVGYENRILAHKDFNDDTKDAGEIGAGHTVTALYEIVPVGGDGAGGAGADEPRTGQAAPAVDPLKYQRTVALTDDARTGELLTVNLRYKDPEATESKKLTHAVKDAGRPFGQASTDYKFASAVASFGMILRNSPHRGTGTLAGVVELAEDGRGSDHDGRRAEFISLVRKAMELAK